MGNALDAARISIAKGFTGVSDPTSTLSAITKGIETISDWKTKREEAKEKLKKDTSDEYLAAEKKAYENMPTDKTFKTNVLEGLESYKERLYTNMKLVQRGVVSNNDNLIFRETATQGIGIVSDMQKNYAKILNFFVAFGSVILLTVVVFADFLVIENFLRVLKSLF